MSLAAAKESSVNAAIAAVLSELVAFIILKEQRAALKSFLGAHNFFALLLTDFGFWPRGTDRKLQAVATCLN